MVPMQPDHKLLMPGWDEEGVKIYSKWQECKMFIVEGGANYLSMNAEQVLILWVKSYAA